MQLPGACPCASGHLQNPTSYSSNGDFCPPTVGLFMQVKELGDKACSVVGDLCDDDSSKKAVKQAISQLGGLNILVNNGGVSTDSMHKGENGADVFHDALTLHVTSALIQ